MEELLKAGDRADEPDNPGDLFARIARCEFVEHRREIVVGPARRPDLGGGELQADAQRRPQDLVGVGDEIGELALPVDDLRGVARRRVRPELERSQQLLRGARRGVGLGRGRGPERARRGPLRRGLLRVLRLGPARVVKTRRRQQRGREHHQTSRSEFHHSVLGQPTRTLGPHRAADGANSRASNGFRVRQNARTARAGSAARAAARNKPAVARSQR